MCAYFFFLNNLFIYRPSVGPFLPPLLSLALRAAGHYFLSGRLSQSTRSGVMSLPSSAWRLNRATGTRDPVGKRPIAVKFSIVNPTVKPVLTDRKYVIPRPGVKRARKMENRTRSIHVLRSPYQKRDFEKKGCLNSRKTECGPSVYGARA